MREIEQPNAFKPRRKESLLKEKALAAATALLVSLGLSHVLADQTKIDPANRRGARARRTETGRGDILSHRDERQTRNLFPEREPDQELPFEHGVVRGENNQQQAPETQQTAEDIVATLQSLIAERADLTGVDP